MRFLHISDLHIGKKVLEASMLEDQKYILNQILETIAIKPVDGILIAGDVYDKPIPPTEAIQVFEHFLKELYTRKIPVYIISGNHDSSIRLSFGSELMKLSQIYISKDFDGSLETIETADEYGPLHIHLIPFLKPAMVRSYYPDVEIKNYQDALYTVLDHHLIDTSVRNVALSHQFVVGANICDSEELSIGGLDQVSASLYDAFDYVALGHIHGPQKIHRDELRYSGTPLKYSFSEEKHHKSMTFVTLKEKGNVEIELVPFKAKHDMKHLIASYDQLMDPDYYAQLNTSDYYYFSLTDENDVYEAYNRLKSIYPNLLKLDYQNRRTMFDGELEVLEKIQRQNPMELLNQFFHSQNNDDMSEEMKEYALKIMEEIFEEDCA